MTFQMLYTTLRKRHKDPIAFIHGDIEKKFDLHDTLHDITPKPEDLKPRHPFICFCAKFWSEFRFIILSVLIVVSALTLQRTLEETIDEYVVKPKIGPSGARIGWKFFLSGILIFTTIVIFIFCKPVAFPP